MCWGWKNAEWQAVPNNIARKFHSSQLCWTRQENEWSIGCCKSFHIPHLFHICRQFNCYIIWNVQNKYATYTYEYKCGRPLTATLFQLVCFSCLSTLRPVQSRTLPPVSSPPQKVVPRLIVRLRKPDDRQSQSSSPPGFRRGPRLTGRPPVGRGETERGWASGPHPFDRSTLLAAP